MATIQLSLEEWNEHQAKLTQAHNENNELRRQLQSRTSDGLLAAGVADIERLTTLLDSALTLVTFAAGNLPPETTPNWPDEALRQVAKSLDALPNFDINKQSLQIELLKLADEAQAMNVERAKRKESKAYADAVDVVREAES